MVSSLESFGNGRRFHTQRDTRWRSLMATDSTTTATTNTYPINGTTALVTGANRGIGRALVDALVARGAAKVYATARNLDSLKDLVASSGGRVVPLQLDVTNPEQVRAAAAAARNSRPTSSACSR
jgi:NADP-dependent 3-hydroxy acid dehydrogenase YdfG